MQSIYGWQVGHTQPADIVVHPPVRELSELPAEFRDLLTHCPAPPAEGVQCFTHRQSVVAHYHHPAGPYFYLIDPAGSEIRMLSHSDNLPDTYSLLMGTVMALISRLRGRLTLHGAVIEIDGRVVALLADKGMGKSTTSLALLRRGHAALSDDVVSLCVESGFRVYPGVPEIRQTLETLRAFGLDPDDYEPIFREVPAETQDKRTIPLHTDRSPRFQPRSMLLDAVYILDRNNAERTTRMTGFHPMLALRELVKHISFTPHAVMPVEFQMLGRLVEQVPVRRVSYPTDLGGLDRLCESLEADLDRLPRRNPAA